jgi:Zinc carboxypeptidase
MKSLFAPFLLLAWSMAASQPALPYGAAVADRFPPPAVAYELPGLQPGRTEWTRNDELETALRALAARGAARLVEAGRTETGQPLLALHFSRGAGRPVALLMGQQHGNEPAGAEALLAVAQQLADARHPLAGVLDRIDVVVLPRANPDGTALARRTNAAGLDINRDHLLLRTREAEALTALVRQWRPVLVVDAHEHVALGRYITKFGAIKAHDMLIQYATTPNLPPALTEAAESGFRQPLLQALARAGISSEWYYTNPTNAEDRLLTMGGLQPELARNAGGLRHAISFLLESRGFDLGRLHAERRVHSHVVAVTSLLTSAAAQADALRALRDRVDAEVAALACRGELLLDAAPRREPRTVTMLDPETGADRPVAVQWATALQVEPRLVRPRPCGYWLAPEAADAAERLGRLGLVVQRLSAAQALRAERYRVTAQGEGERRDTLGRVADPQATRRVAVALEPGQIDAPAGSFLVMLDQPLAHLATAALEPDTAGSWYAQRLIADLAQLVRVLEPVSAAARPAASPARRE